MDPPHTLRGNHPGDPCLRPLASRTETNVCCLHHFVCGYDGPGRQTQEMRQDPARPDARWQLPRGVTWSKSEPQPRKASWERWHRAGLPRGAAEICRDGEEGRAGRRRSSRGLLELRVLATGRPVWFFGWHCLFLGFSSNQVTGSHPIGNGLLPRRGIP